MFEAKIYQSRRKELRQKLDGGLLLFPGNGESAMNYSANTYHYRQDSNFLYFFGIDKPPQATTNDDDIETIHCLSLRPIKAMR